MGEQVVIKLRNNEYGVLINGEEICTIQDKINLEYVRDVNWDEVLKKTFDIDELI